MAGETAAGGLGWGWAAGALSVAAGAGTAVSVVLGLGGAACSWADGAGAGAWAWGSAAGAFRTDWTLRKKSSFEVPEGMYSLSSPFLSMTTVGIFGRGKMAVRYPASWPPAFRRRATAAEEMLSATCGPSQ